LLALCCSVLHRRVLVHFPHRIVAVPAGAGVWRCARVAFICLVRVPVKPMGNYCCCAWPCLEGGPDALHRPRRPCVCGHRSAGPRPSGLHVFPQRNHHHEGRGAGQGAGRSWVPAWLLPEPMVRAVKGGPLGARGQALCGQPACLRPVLLCAPLALGGVHVCASGACCLQCARVPPGRKVLYFFLSVAGWGGSLAVIIVMFVLFDDCDLSKFFVAFTLCLGVVTTIMSRACSAWAVGWGSGWRPRRKTRPSFPAHPCAQPPAPFFVPSHSAAACACLRALWAYVFPMQCRRRLARACFLHPWCSCAYAPGLPRAPWAGLNGRRFPLCSRGGALVGMCALVSAVAWRAAGRHACFLCWGALTSNPNLACNKYANDNDVGRIVIGILISAIMLSWTRCVAMSWAVERRGHRVPPPLSVIMWWGVSCVFGACVQCSRGWLGPRSVYVRVLEVQQGSRDVGIRAGGQPRPAQGRQRRRAWRGGVCPRRRLAARAHLSSSCRCTCLALCMNAVCRSPPPPIASSPLPPLVARRRCLGWQKGMCTPPPPALWCLWWGCCWGPDGEYVHRVMWSWRA
jgi:hypothetical protein